MRDDGQRVAAMEETLFTKIIARKVPAKIAYEDERYIVIHDIQPQAPAHVLVIPKKVIPTLNDLTPADAELVGEDRQFGLGVRPPSRPHQFVVAPWAAPIIQRL